MSPHVGLRNSLHVEPSASRIAPLKGREGLSQHKFFHIVFHRAFNAGQGGIFHVAVPVLLAQPCDTKPAEQRSGPRGGIREISAPDRGLAPCWGLGMPLADL